MENLTLQLSSDTQYIGKASSIGMGILEGFLFYDVGAKNNESWKAFIGNPNATFELGNYSYLKKIDNGLVLGFQDHWAISDKDEDVLQLTLAQMNYILDKWQDALQKKPNKIVIIKDDKGEIRVEFKD